MDVWPFDGVQPLKSVTRVTIFSGESPCFVILVEPELLISHEVEDIFGSGTRSSIAEVAVVFHFSAALQFFRLAAHLATRRTTKRPIADIWSSLNVVLPAAPIRTSIDQILGEDQVLPKHSHLLLPGAATLGSVREQVILLQVHHFRHVVVQALRLTMVESEPLVVLLLLFLGLPPLAYSFDAALAFVSGVQQAKISVKIHNLVWVVFVKVRKLPLVLFLISEHLFLWDPASV